MVWLRDALIELADDHLVLGYRLSEWCGHAPMIEEDMAMPNMALDLIGAARSLYTHAGAVEGAGRDEDQLAYFRVERDYRNCLLAERPNGDFAHTMLKQLYFAAFMEPFWVAAQASADPVVAGIAGKAVKEVRYHIRHAGEWVIRLGDGTEESATRMQAAVDALHLYTDELFLSSPAATKAAEAGVLPTRGDMRASWDNTINDIFAQANLTRPDIRWPVQGGRDGIHGEELGHLLAELQYVQRAYPGCQW